MKRARSLVFVALRRPPRPPPLSSLRRLRRHARPEARSRAPDHGPARGARHQDGKGRRALRRGDRASSAPFKAQHRRQSAPLARHALQPADGQDPAPAARGGHVQAAARRAARRDALPPRASRPWSTSSTCCTGSAANDSSMVDSHRQLPDHHRRHPEDARDRPHGRPALVSQRATEKAGVQAALSQRQSHAARRQGADRRSSRPSRRAPPSRPPSRRVSPRRPAPSPPTTPAWSPSPRASSVRCPTCGAAASPAGFDCSGFTMYVYSHFGVGLPHNAAAQQAMRAVR